jgi:hypothetical protein
LLLDLQRLLWFMANDDFDEALGRRSELPEYA